MTAARSGKLRQAKIQHLRLPAGGHEDVGRLDVAMDDPAGVGGVQGVCDLCAQVEHFVGRQGLAGDHLPQRLAFQQFHGDEGLPGGFVDFVDRANVRMIERGGSLGFALKTAEGLRVLGKVLGQKFQSDGASELEVFRLVDDTHAARAQRPEHAIVRNGLASNRRSCTRRVTPRVGSSAATSPTWSPGDPESFPPCDEK